MRVDIYKLFKITSIGLILSSGTILLLAVFNISTLIGELIVIFISFFFLNLVFGLAAMAEAAEKKSIRQSMLISNGLAIISVFLSYSIYWSRVPL